jgi:hypothetical protein
MNEVIVPNEAKMIFAGMEPKDQMEAALVVASSLKGVMNSKPNPIEFHGKRYLEADDWQVLGTMCGVGFKTELSGEVEFSGYMGFKAKGYAIRISDGAVISEAEAVCVNDEPQWANKALSHMASMAQTRAMSKVAANCMRWIAVRAGYAGTPAEEMEGVFPDQEKPKRKAKPKKEVAEPAPASSDLISEKQAKRFYAIAKGNGYSVDEMTEYLQNMHGIDNPRELTKGEAYELACEWADTSKG